MPVDAIFFEIFRGESFFRDLVEAAPDGVVVLWDGRRDDHMVLINAQVEKLFGYARADLLGQPIELLVPERYRSKHPGYRAGYFAAPTGRAMAGTVVNLFGLRKDGTEFAAEVSLSPIEMPGVLDAGVAFLQEPITPDALLREVRKVLDEDPSGPQARGKA